MGATVSFGAVAVAGLPLIASIVGTVVAAIAVANHGQLSRPPLYKEMSVASR